MASSRAHKMAKGQFASGGAVGRAMRTIRREYAMGGSVPARDAIALQSKSGATPVLFLGESSATADKEALSRAKEMERRGMSRNQILQETGWFKDGNAWNYETDDRDFVGSEDRVIGHMEDVAPHAEAMTAYPALGNIPVQPMFQGKDVGGSFAPSRFRLPWQRPAPGSMQYRPGMSQEERTRTQLHELQHGVDLEEPNFREYTDQSNPYYEQRAERRAFNAQMRQPLTPEQRRTLPPWETEPYAMQSSAAHDQTLGSLLRPKKPIEPSPTMDAFNAELAPEDRVVSFGARRYADGGDVVKERAMFLPLGTYGDGTTRAAWPGLLYEPAAAWKRMMDSGYRPGNAENTRKMAEDSFTVAGAVPLAGLAAGAVRPGVSLGSGGGRLGKSLPMDEASRMARAREMGFDVDTPIYHGTHSTFDEFDTGQRQRFTAPNKNPQIHTTTSADEAETYGPNVMGLYKRGQFFDIENPMATQDNVQRHFEKLAARREQDVWNNDALPYDTAVAAREFEDFMQNSRNDGVIAHRLMQSQIAKARRAGYDGIRIRGGWGDENAGDHYVVFDPRNIRSVDAAFDPAKSNSTNLLAANPSTAAILALMADARRDRDQN